MGATIKRKGRKADTVLHCDAEGCEATYGPVQCHTAAPELEACEAAHKAEGWGYTIGFFAMLCGPSTLCPAHAKGGADVATR